MPTIFKFTCGRDLELDLGGPAPFVFLPFGCFSGRSNTTLVAHAQYKSKSRFEIEINHIWRQFLGNRERGKGVGGLGGSRDLKRKNYFMPQLIRFAPVFHLTLGNVSKKLLARGWCHNSLRHTV